MKRNFTIRFLSIAFLFLPYLAKAQTYCVPAFSTGCSSGDYISNFTLNGTCSTSISDLGTTCPASPTSLDDRTVQTPVKLLQNHIYTGAISVGRLGDYAAIWIDFNNDGIFSASELVGTAGTFSSTPISTAYPSGTPFSITIPAAASAPIGTYRMRIRIVSEVSQSTIDPCASYTYGETRDYMVSIIPAPPAVSSNSPVCTGQTLDLFATDAATGSYSWTGPVSSSQQNPVILGATTADAGIYSATITSNGLTSCPATTNVVINTSPAATVTPAGAPTFCANSFTLSANTGAGLSYSWLDGGVPTGITTSTNTVSLSGSYQVIVSNSTCSDTSAATALTLNPVPPATITPAGATAFCVGQSAGVVLQANTGAGLLYQWQSGAGGNIGGATDATYTATTTDNYTLIVSNGTCADTSAPVAITANTVPVATITPQGSTTFCQGGQVPLQATTGGGLFYQWQDDGNNINGATNSTFIATDAGNYSVIVSNGNCADTSSADSVTVNPLPVATATPLSSTVFCDGGNVVLQANTGAGLTYQWQNGINTIPGATDATYTATTSGSYTVVVSDGTCTNTSVAVAVTVNVVPLATITPSNSVAICDGQSVTLQANTGPGLLYQWQNSLGNDISGATDATFTATNAGGYNVIVSNANCADTSAATTVIVNPVPLATITPNTPVTFCVGGNVTFQTDSAPGLTYQWLIDGNIIPGTDDSLFTTNTSGSYSVIVTNASNCSDTSISVDVTAYTPDTTLAILGQTTFCQGNSVSLTAVAADTCAACTYQWYDNGNPIADNTSSFTADSTGNYYVIITNGTGCSGTSATAAVVASAFPTDSVTFTGDTTFCSGDSLVLQAHTDIGTTFQWTNSGVSIPGATNSAYTATVAGSYNVLIANAAGCTDSTIATTVTVNPLPDTTLTISGQTSLCAGNGVGLTAAATCTGCTYQWYDNGIAIADNTATLTTDSSGNYYVTITNSFGCSNTSATRQIIVNAFPADSITYTGSPSFCQGDSLVLHANTDNGISYQWLNSGNVINGATDSTYTTFVAGSYQVVVANATGCSDTSVAVITSVMPFPSATVTVTQLLNFCAGQSVTLHANPTTGVLYQWYVDDTVITGATAETYIATLTGSYTVLVTNANGCSNMSAATPVNVTTLVPAVVTSASADTFCQGGSVVLTSNTGAVGYTYHWQKNGVTIVPAATTTTYTATATGNYRVVFINGTGCSDTSNVIPVLVNPIPTSVITATTGTTFCLGGNVVLKASIAANDEYQWLLETPAFPSGTIILDSTADSIFVNTSGSYRILITNSLTGCFDTSAVRNVTVNQPPTVTITGGPTTFCQNDSVVLTANTTTPPGTTIPANGYQWNNEGSPIALATNPAYTAHNAGSYSITITNSNGCKDTSARDSVTVRPLPPSHITPATDTSVCPGNIVVLNANIDTGITYHWHRNGFSIPGATTTTYIASTSGSYTLVTTNFYGCMLTSTAVAVLIDTPKAVITAVATTVCQGHAAVLNANTGNNYTYQWERNNAPIAGATNSSYNATVAGSYIVVVTNGTGCIATSDSVQVVVNPVPTVTVTAMSDTSFCIGDSVILIATADTIVTYQWHNGLNQIPGATDSSYTATASGTYTVVATNGYNCPAVSIPIHVTANPLPVATITPEGSTTVCVSSSIVLDANTGPNYTYQWFLNGVAIPGATNASYAAATSGDYTVTVTSGTNCSTTSAPITVTVYPAPELISENPTTFCFGSTDVLLVHTRVQNTAGFTYQWQDNGVNINGAIDSTFSAYMAGTYTCVVTAINGCVSTEDTPIVLKVNPLPTPLIVYNGLTSTLSTGNFVTYQWYKNHNTINGATGPSVVVSGSGDYYVAVSDTNGCVTLSDVYILAPLDVNNVNGIGNAIKMYPNPANTTVHIESPVSVNVSISALDGRVVLHKDDAKDIDVSSLANGVYMVMMYDQNGALLKIDKLAKTAY